MVQTICFALMGPVAGCFASYGTTPAWLRGFGLLGRCIVPMSYREASVSGPMRSQMIFGLTPAFGRSRPVGCEWRSAIEGNARDRSRRGERSNRCPIVAGCRGRPSRR
jgi:hypothetical protein